jgi:hypothetical protein
MNTVVLWLLWGVLVLNVGLSFALMRMMRRAALLHLLMMDICLRAWRLRTHPGALLTALRLAARD